MQCRYPKLIPNEDWLAIVDRVLAGDGAARTLLWIQVGLFVERLARLPIGPLNGDDEARRDIALRVLGKLEHRDAANLRSWRDRHTRRHHASAWWSWIKSVAYSVAIDYARVCKSNIAVRGAPFVWVEVATTDPQRLTDAMEDLQIDPAAVYSQLAELRGAS